jgi:hypothetical protein
VEFFRKRYQTEADEVMAEAAVIDLVRCGQIPPADGAAALGMVPDDFARLMTQHGLLPSAGEPARRPIEEVLAELAAEVPAEDWAALPTDLTDHLDHYLYGLPKR